MPRLRKKKPSGFTIINNTAVNDPNLSGKALGYLVRLASKPDDWDFSINGLASEYADGRDSIQSALQELEDNGYLMRKRIVKNGKYIDMEYIFDDEPMPEALALAREKRQKKEAKKSTKTTRKSASVAENPQQPQKRARKKAIENNADTHFSPHPENPDVETPVADFPYPEKPYMEKPYTENPDDNIINKNKINNTNNLSYQSDILHSGKEIIDKIDRIEKQATNYEDYNTYKEIIKENIEYDYFASAYTEPDIRNRPEGSISELDEIVEIMTETVCSSAPTIRVGKENKPSEVVRSRFLKINEQDILYLFACLAKQTKKIHNPKAYIITSLYNTPLTKELGTSAAFRYDFSNDPIMLQRSKLSEKGEE